MVNAVFYPRQKLRTAHFIKIIFFAAAQEPVCNLTIYVPAKKAVAFQNVP